MYNNSEGQDMEAMEGGCEIKESSTMPTRPSNSEPKVVILARPNESNDTERSTNCVKNGDYKSEAKLPHQTKTIEQRQQDYAEARQRILGDVRFVEEEKEVNRELQNRLTPAEILKMKVKAAMQENSNT